MNIYALDSNIISYILKDNIAVIKRYEQEMLRGADFIIPPIVFYEIQRGLLSNNSLKKSRNFEKFCKDIEIGEFTHQVWLKAAQIYAELTKQGKPIGGNFDGDIFIAAYCIVNDYTLITGNKKHFSSIDGLKFVEWS